MYVGRHPSRLYADVIACMQTWKMKDTTTAEQHTNSTPTQIRGWGALDLWQTVMLHYYIPGTPVLRTRVSGVYLFTRYTVEFSSTIDSAREVTYKVPGTWYHSSLITAVRATCRITPTPSQYFCHSMSYDRQGLRASALMISPQHAEQFLYLWYVCMYP